MRLSQPLIFSSSEFLRKLEYYEELAYHYSRSDDREKALEYLVKAGDKSREAFANEEAIDYYQQALNLMDDWAGLKPAPTIGHIYQSLGEIYFALMKYKEALECCHKALEYTTDKNQRVRIYSTMGWICERDFRLDPALKYLNAGIAELGDDTQSLEMARICIPLCWVAIWKGNAEEAIDIALRGLKIVEGTEHCFELAQLYIPLIWMYGFAPSYIDKAFEHARKSVEVAQQSGNSYLIAESTHWLGFVHMRNGEDDIAIRLMRESLETSKKIGYNYGIARTYAYLSVIYHEKSDWDGAIECLERCLDMPALPGSSSLLLLLAWTYLQKGGVEKAVQHSKEHLESECHSSMRVAQSLGVMEEAFEVMGRRDEFASFCERFGREKKGTTQGLKLTQWYLEPKELSGLFTHSTFVDEFDERALKSEWEWMNPRGDSSYSLSSEASWLEMRAAPGSKLETSYLGKSDAPRLVQGISGDFAAEVKLKAASDGLPSVGGLLIWKDRENFIRFERGICGKHEISLAANIQGTHVSFGRGMLVSDFACLRLERVGDRFSAYCSSDGENWMTCGEVNFPAEDPIHIGIHTTGSLGLIGIAEVGVGTETATRFDYFKVLKRTS